MLDFTSNRSILHKAANTKMFNVADFIKGCDVSSVIVDGKNKLDDAWYCRYIAVDSAGRLYVGDQNNHVLVRIDLDGTHTIIAGSGHAGWTNAHGREAQFKYPMALAVAPDGTIYVSDWGNDAIRRVLPNGRVETFAGSGIPGFKDGIGRDAWFHGPHGCAVGPDGTVYVVDTYNHCIRRVHRDGTVSTIGGNGVAGLQDGRGLGETQFNKPIGVAVDKYSNIYVADHCNQVIRRIAPDGVVQTVGGSGISGNRDGAVDEARFEYPTDVAVGHDGALYVADCDNHLVRCITPRGWVATIAGTGLAGCKDGLGADAQFNCPRGITVGPDGCLYIMDSENKRIRKITPVKV
eukprot:GEMP01022105.1.p1 GENE.GEMP01022105.1~~GEMP01022105.1.p1  ORF type:complete len:349 (+),score=87.32 GEMP01022105.1:341-1387(+)